MAAPMSPISLCSITCVLVLVLVVCLLAYVGCELMGAVETFATDDANLTPGDQTYFTISQTNPGSQTRSSSSRLRQEIQEQKDGGDAKQGDAKKDDKTTDPTTPYAYWFWNGDTYAKKTIAETLHIINIWKDNCPNNCNLWIQIGDDTTPLNVNSSTNVVLKTAVENGLDKQHKGLNGCYTPSSETPNKDFTCIPCPQRSQLNQSALFRDWHNNPDRAVSTSGHDMVHTDNYWSFLPEYISKTATTDLVQKIFTIEKMCPTTCKLIFHGGTSKPIPVNSVNETNIRTVVQGVKDKGAKKGITLCCALKTASIDAVPSSRKTLIGVDAVALPPIGRRNFCSIT